MDAPNLYSNGCETKQNRCSSDQLSIVGGGSLESMVLRTESDALSSDGRAWMRQPNFYRGLHPVDHEPNVFCKKHLPAKNV